MATAPPAPGTPPALEIEHKVTGSPQAQAAGAAVMALAKAARSFVLYDANNKLVRQLLEQFRDKTAEALTVAAALPLDFGAFEVKLKGEVVYLDQDREKSMAFKLFRDGVRRITLLQGVSFEELFRLLEIIALRYTAMRQQEDDSVTLIRKADFKSIQLVAVEGFAPAEERPEADVPMEAAFKGPKVELPQDFDLPLPRLPNPGRVAYRELPPTVLSGLLAEESDASWAMSALALGRVLLDEAKKNAWSTTEDLNQYFLELREAMLADNAYGPLKQLIELLEKAGATAAHQQLLAALADPKTLDLILDVIPADVAVLPPSLVALLPYLAGGAALEKMIAEPDERKRALLLELVLAANPKAAEEIVKKVPTLEPQLARTVARGLATRSPKLASEVGKLLLNSPDEAMKLDGLEALLAGKGEISMLLVTPLLDAQSPQVRARALDLVEKRGDESVLSKLVFILENKERPLPEVEALGRVMSVLNPVGAARTFLAWGHPKARVLGGLSAQQKRLQWAAVAGMAHIPGAEAERQLQAIGKEATDENLKRHCMAALSKHRKAAAPRG